LTQRLHKVEGNRRRKRNLLELDWKEQAVARQDDEVLDGLDAEGRQEIDMSRIAPNERRGE
jgi:hypothetical protein